MTDICRVCVITDRSDVAERVVEALAGDGCDVETSSAAATLRSALAAHNHSVLLVDASCNAFAGERTALELVGEAPPFSQKRVVSPRCR